MDFKKFKKHGITKINESKLNISINDFLNNDIILIKSGTGTGKTKNIGKICKELKEKTGCRVLSVVNLINLSREQIKTFNEESNTILFDYQKDLAKFDDNDGVICLNSLYKLNDIENYDMNNIVLVLKPPYCVTVHPQKCTCHTRTPTGPRSPNILFHHSNAMFCLLCSS
jgi:hypothetical protein